MLNKSSSPIITLLNYLSLLPIISTPTLININPNHITLFIFHTNTLSPSLSITTLLLILIPLQINTSLITIIICFVKLLLSQYLIFFRFNWKLLEKINSELINSFIVFVMSVKNRLNLSGKKNVGRKLKYSELGLKSGSVVENVVVVFCELHETYLVLANIDRNG